MALWKKIKTLLRSLSTDPLHAYRLFLQTQRFVVYSADPSAISPPDPRDGATLEKLSDEALRQLPQAFERQAERLERFGFNDAFAVVHQTAIVHVAWLVPWEHDRQTARRDIKLAPGEAEITHCLTPPEHRGKGYYPFAIRLLCQQAHAAGFKRVLMMTNIDNVASQHGIEKAGLKRCGSVVRIVFPVLRQALTFRTHRWRRNRLA
jgi:RimJ/RimL family protein N-acetyltransferase